mgnify:CR=1 FL=1
MNTAEIFIEYFTGFIYFTLGIIILIILIILILISTSFQGIFGIVIQLILLVMLLIGFLINAILSIIFIHKANKMYILDKIVHFVFCLFLPPFTLLTIIHNKEL